MYADFTEPNIDVKILYEKIQTGLGTSYILSAAFSSD